MANLFEDVKGVERLQAGLDAMNDLRRSAEIGDDILEFSNIAKATEGLDVTTQAGTDALNAEQGALAGQQGVAETTRILGTDTGMVDSMDFVDSLFPDASAEGAVGAAEDAGATKNLLTKDLNPGDITNCNKNLKSLLVASEEINQAKRGALMRNAYVLKPLLKLDEASFAEIMVSEGSIDTELLGKLSEMKPSEMNAFLETFGKSSEATDASKLPYTDIRAILTNLPNDNPELYVDTVKNIREGLTVFSNANPRPTNYGSIMQAFKDADNITNFQLATDATDIKNANALDNFLGAMRKSREIKGADQLLEIAGTDGPTAAICRYAANPESAEVLNAVIRELNEAKGAKNLEITLNATENLGKVAKAGKWSKTLKGLFFLGVSGALTAGGIYEFEEHFGNNNGPLASQPPPNDPVRIGSGGCHNRNMAMTPSMIGTGCGNIIYQLTKGSPDYICEPPPSPPYVFHIPSPPPFKIDGANSCQNCVEHYIDTPSDGILDSLNFYKKGQAQGSVDIAEQQCNSVYNIKNGDYNENFSYYIVWFASVVFLIILAPVVGFKTSNLVYVGIINLISIILGFIAENRLKKSPVDTFNDGINNNIPDTGSLTKGHIISIENLIKDLNKIGGYFDGNVSYIIIANVLMFLIALALSASSRNSGGIPSEDDGENTSSVTDNSVHGSHENETEGNPQVTTDRPTGRTNVTIQVGKGRGHTGGQRGGKRNILPKTLNKFNKWLIIFLLVLAILINYFYNSNRSTMHKKNYIQEMKKERSRNNIQVKEESKNLSYEPSIVFGGQFI